MTLSIQPMLTAVPNYRNNLISSNKTNDRQVNPSFQGGNWFSQSGEWCSRQSGPVRLAISIICLLALAGIIWGANELDIK